MRVAIRFLFGVIFIQTCVIIWLLAFPEIETIVQTETVVKTEIQEVYKEIEKPIEVEPTYMYHITSSEREMLARLVYREANIESIECQMAVVSVVINRWNDGYWGDTLQEVVYSNNQFTPANLISVTTPTEQNYKAVDYVLKNGVTIPEYVMYFRADYHFKWDGYKAYKKIDKTYFGYMEKDRNK